MTLHLTVPLEMSDCINEGRILPGFNLSLRVRGSYHVSRCLFDDAESVEFQLADDRCLPRTRRAGDDEPSHFFAGFRNSA